MLWVGIFFFVLLLRLFTLTLTYAQNVLFYDKIDIYGSLVDADAGAAFFYQHPIGRQGFSFVLERYLMQLTAWNTIAVSVFVVILLVLCCATALWIHMRIFGRLRWHALVYPLVFFSVAHYEIITNDPYPPAVFALWGLLLTCLAYTFSGRTKYVLFILGALSAIYSAAGFVAWPGLLLVLLGDYISARKRGVGVEAGWKYAVGIILILPLTLFIGFDATVLSRVVVSPDIVQLASFAGLLFISTVFSHATFVSIIAGIALMVFVGYRIGAVCRLWLRNPKGVQAVSAVTVILGLYSLCFVCIAAIGRHDRGLAAAFASRYVVYMIPVWIVLYFSLLALTSRTVRTWLLLLFLSGIIVAELHYGAYRLDRNAAISTGKRDWSACYVRTKDWQYCNTTLRFQIYPSDDPGDIVRFDTMLRYLETHSLNFFANVK